jgi:excisionase family DNA binding protein
MIEKNYTTGQVAENFNVHVNTIRNLIKKRELRIFRVGKKIVIPQSAIDEYKDNNKVAPWHDQKDHRQDTTSNNTRMGSGIFTQSVFQRGQNIGK